MKVNRLLDDDVFNTSMVYIDVNKDSLILMKNYIQQDLNSFMNDVSKVSKLRAEEINSLLNNMAYRVHEMIVLGHFYNKDYQYLKLMFEDLSHLFLSNRFVIFNTMLKENFYPKNRYLIKSGTKGSGPYLEDVFTDMYNDVFVPQNDTNTTFVHDKVNSNSDDVGVFGFILWSKKINNDQNLDKKELSKRYTVRYFIPALESKKDSYISCASNANVALANLTRARYGVEVYDTWNNKTVEIENPYFETDQVFADPRFDNFFIRDFFEVKFILLQLK